MSSQSQTVSDPATMMSVSDEMIMQIYRIHRGTTVDGRQFLRTLSTSNFRGLYNALIMCITGKCQRNVTLFVSMYRDQEHRSSCPIGKTTCVVCFMQVLDDATGDSVDHTKHLLTNDGNSAIYYLRCRNNLTADAHARKLLLEIKRKSEYLR